MSWSGLLLFTGLRYVLMFVVVTTPSDVYKRPQTSLLLTLLSLHSALFVMIFHSLLLVATLVASTLASPVDLLPSPMGVTVNHQEVACRTNAECLAKRLPVRKPTRARRDRSLTPRASAVPGATSRLKILINGAPAGYVSESNSFYTTQNAADALAVYTPTSALSFEELFVAPASQIGDGVLAAISPSWGDGAGGGNNFRANSNSFGWIQQSPSSQTTPAKVNAKPYGTSYAVETVVWTYDPESTGLLAGWRNTADGYPPTVVLYPFVSTQGTMYWSGDPTAIAIGGFTRVDVVLESV